MGDTVSPRPQHYLTGLCALLALGAAGCPLGHRSARNAPGIGDVRQPPRAPRTRSAEQAADPGEFARTVQLDAGAQVGGGIAQDNRSVLGGAYVEFVTQVKGYESDRSLSALSLGKALQADPWRLGLAYHALGSKDGPYRGRLRLKIGYEAYKHNFGFGTGMRIEVGPVWGHSEGHAGGHAAGCAILAPFMSISLCFRGDYLINQGVDLAGTFGYSVPFTFVESR